MAYKHQHTSQVVDERPQRERHRARWWIVLATVHIAACVAMWAVATTGVFPTLTTAKGFWTFAIDASDFHLEATQMASIVQHDGWAAWWGRVAQPHSRVVSLFYAELGASLLSAVPFMTATYLLIVLVIARLGTFLFDRTSGLIAAGMVACWPSFFAHSTQLVRDPLFILSQLSFVTGAVLLLLRGDANWRRCAEIALWSIAGFYVASSIRPYTAELNLLIWLLALSLLMVAAVRQRHVPWRKVGAGLLVLLVFGPEIVARVRADDPGLQTVAPFSSAAILLRKDGQSLGSIEELANFDATAAARAARAGDTPSEPQPSEPAVPVDASRSAPRTLLQKLEYWLLLVVDKRNDFSRFDIAGGSNIDRDVTFTSAAEVIGYLPRAMHIGLGAPFPSAWLSNDGEGRVVHIVAGLETALMYVLIPLALLSVWNRRGDVAVWLAILFAVGGMIMLGLIIPNVGTIFRLRYSFWFVVVVLAAPELRRLGVRILTPAVRQRGITPATLLE